MAASKDKYIAHDSYCSENDSFLMVLKKFRSGNFLEITHTRTKDKRYRQKKMYIREEDIKGFHKALGNIAEHAVERKKEAAKKNVELKLVSFARENILWTDPEDRYIKELLKSGEKTGNIAKTVQRSPDSVRERLKKLKALNSKTEYSHMTRIEQTLDTIRKFQDKEQDNS